MSKERKQSNVPVCYVVNFSTFTKESTMVPRIAILFIVLSMLTVSAFAFPPDKNGGVGKCSECHTLSVKEATTLLKGIDKVLAVEFSELPGFC